MSPESATLIIAEAGVNHNGDPELAMRLVDVACDAGADVVKFQIFNSELLATASAEKAGYQQQTTGSEQTQQAMLKALELSHDEFTRIRDYCDEKGIEFLATAFDDASLEFLLTLNVKRLKIPSGELTNLPFIRQHALTGLPLIISTGMATLDEIRDALAMVAYTRINPQKTPVNLQEVRASLSAYSMEQLAQDVTLLQCTTAYPTADNEVNLKVIQTLANEFHCPVGLSDHTPDTMASPLAVVMGACLIEKHFTLDKHLPGPDHQASLEPDELALMTRDIRRAEAMLGHCEKSPSDTEQANAQVARKSLVAARAIEQGQTLSAEDITARRPGNGLSPAYFWDLCGQTAEQSYDPDQPL